MRRTESGEINSTTEQFSVCLRRMANLFDSGTSVSGNRLLADKPHQQGFQISRSQSNRERMPGPPFGDGNEENITLSDLGRANEIVNGTPIKMLMAQEMKKEVDSKHNSPNIVARLMGIEALPQQWPNSSVLRVRSRGHSRRTLSHSDIPSESWQEHDAFWDRGMHDIHPCPQQNYKDVYEVWKPEKSNHAREGHQHKERYDYHTNEKKMDLIRRKFMEAKRLSTDESLRQSKEFQDALEVLSSNKDSFLRFLQEPNSMSQRPSEFQSVPPPSDTKRITVLRPCRMVNNEKLPKQEMESNKQINRPPQLFHTSVWDMDKSIYSPSNANPKHDVHPAQPTRIVVLKPSTVKTQDIKGPVSTPFGTPRMEDLYEEPQDSETQHAKRIAQEITRMMRENLIGEQGDERLACSALSNGHVGDQSSFNKLDNEYAAGSLSDSEIISPSCRHSWDYINRFGSPYSSSSFSRASCSPDSSVSREAKKRLSERWTMMASNVNAHDKYVQKSSSTLGEMLALSDATKTVRSQEDSGAKEDDAHGSTSSIIVDINGENSDSFPENLSRSKSAPLSSTISGARFNVEALDPETNKIHASKELTKSKSTKSSLKGKVSSIFFSRKKPSQVKSDAAGKSECQKGRVGCVESPLFYSKKMSNVSAQSVNDVGPEDHGSFGLHVSSGKNYSELIGTRHDSGVVLLESEWSNPQSVVSGNLSWSQDQPSPISVLEPPFEEDLTIPEHSSTMKQDHLGSQLLSQPIKSNLIDKSPPIGTIARTLSWDDSGAGTATSYPLKAFGSAGLEETEDWLFLVRRLLSLAGLDGEVQADSFCRRWHSLESPLNPSLRDMSNNLNDQEPFYEIKQRRGRSNWKLVFDSVNNVLAEITGYRPCDWVHNKLRKGGSEILVEQVCERMKDLFFSDVRCVPEDGRDSNSLVVENMVRKELMGGGWVELSRPQKYFFGKDLEGKLLEELVEEAVVEMIGRLK